MFRISCRYRSLCTCCFDLLILSHCATQQVKPLSSMVSWQASQCLLPCVQERHPTYFLWTAKYCTNKPFYVLNVRMKVQPSHSRWQIHKADQSSDPACKSSSLTGPARLLNLIIESAPEAAARYKPEASTPLHKAKQHLNHHWWEPWMRSPTLPSGAQTAEPKLPWDTRIWQSRAIQTRSASLKQAHPRSWQQRFASSSCSALQGNKCHLTTLCTHPTVTATGQALQPH